MLWERAESFFLQLFLSSDVLLCREVLFSGFDPFCYFFSILRCIDLSLRPPRPLKMSCLIITSSAVYLRSLMQLRSGLIIHLRHGIVARDRRRRWYHWGLLLWRRHPVPGCRNLIRIYKVRRGWIVVIGKGLRWKLRRELRGRAVGRAELARGIVWRRLGVCLWLGVSRRVGWVVRVGRRSVGSTRAHFTNK